MCGSLLKLIRSCWKIAYTPDGYCTGLKQVIKTATPDLVSFPQTIRSRFSRPHSAAMPGKGMAR